MDKCFIAELPFTNLNMQFSIGVIAEIACCVEISILRLL